METNESEENNKEGRLTMATLKTCLFCLDPFLASRRDQRFCSDACKRSSLAKTQSTIDKYNGRTDEDNTDK
jgi:hypothetical protein